MLVLTALLSTSTVTVLFYFLGIDDDDDDGDVMVEQHSAAWTQRQKRQRETVNKGRPIMPRSIFGTTKTNKAAAADRVITVVALRGRRAINKFAECVAGGARLANAGGVNIRNVT